MENITNASGQQNSNQNNKTSETDSFNGFTSMFGGAQKLPEILKGLGNTAAQKIGGLSSTQKVIGGALLVLGARYLTKKSPISFRNKMGRKSV